MMNHSHYDGMAEGKRRRDYAFKLLEARRAVYVRRARRAFLERLLAVGVVTADDVRDVVKLPPGINPNLFGCVPSAFAQQGIVECDGVNISRRPQRHAGIVRRWRLVSADAAIKWLAENPDLPDVPTGRQDQPAKRRPVKPLSERT